MTTTPRRTGRHKAQQPAAAVLLLSIVALLLTALPTGAAVAAAAPAATPTPTNGPSTAATGGYANTVLGTAGVASYWRLGERTGTTTTDSKSTVNGTYVGGVTLGMPGAPTGDTDTAVSFDGAGGSVSFGNNY